MSEPVTIEITDIPVDQIRPSPYQPRINFELEDLRGSIIKYGIVDPIKVRKVGDYYELIDGERRWRIATQEGFETVPCIVTLYSDEEADALAWRLNTERKQYSLEERAKHFKSHQDDGLSGASIGRIHGYSHNQVNRLLAIFRFPEKYQLLLWSGDFAFKKYQYLYHKGLINSESSARVQDITDLLERATLDGLTERQFEAVVDAYASDLTKRQVDEAAKAAAKIDLSNEKIKRSSAAVAEPEIKAPETPEDFAKAAKALLDESERRKTAEQKREEKLEKNRVKARKSLLTGRGNAKSKIEAAKKVGVDTSEFEKRLEEIKEKISEDPEGAFEDTQELKTEITAAKKHHTACLKAEKEAERARKQIKTAMKKEIDTSTFDVTLRNIESMIKEDPQEAFKKSKKLKEEVIEAINTADREAEIKRRVEAERKKAETKRLAELVKDNIEEVSEVMIDVRTDLLKRGIETKPEELSATDAFELKEILEAEKERIKERMKDPKIMKRGRLFRNLMAQSLIMQYKDSLFCPSHENDSGVLQWSCCSKSIDEAYKELSSKF